MPSRLTVLLVPPLFQRPAVKLWLLLVILQARVTIMCHVKCGESCTSWGCHAACSSEPIDNIPSFDQEFKLHYNRISSLGNDSFISKGLKELSKLSLNRCGLETIEFGAFNGLTKLTRLSLQHNELREIIPRIFEKNNHLEYLDLSHNRIEYLKGNEFSGLVNLKTVHLSSNKLRSIHPHLFVGLTNLQNIDLSNNPGLQIVTDTPLINSYSLKLLRISHCNVGSVSFETFAKVSALEWLDLSYNNLRSLDINILKALPKLSQVKLHHNGISEIIQGRLEKFSSLERLDLDENTIEHAEREIFCQFMKDNYFRRIKKHYNNPFKLLGLQNLQRSILSKNTGLQIPTEPRYINSYALKYFAASFCSVSALELLDLSYNNLRSVDVNILEVLPNMVVLDLNDNPLHCNRQLLEVWQRCQYFKIETINNGKAPKCVTPSKIKGVSLGDLGKNQSLQDKLGDIFDLDFESYKIKKSIHFDQYNYFFRHVIIPVREVLSILGITGNVILIIIITCNKDMRTISNMYILNLAISDLIFLKLIFLDDNLHFLIPNRRPAHYIVCVFIIFSRRMSVCLTAYSVSVLSFQRYRVTVDPLHAKTSRRASVATIFGVWIVAALFAFPTAMVKNKCKRRPLSEFDTYFRLTSLFELLMSCVLPLCVIIFSYCLMSRHLMQNSFSTFGMAQNPQIKKRRNAAKVVLGLTIVFVISYVPSHFLSAFSVFYYKTSERNFVRYSILPFLNGMSLCFLCLNSCFNPVALFFTSPAVRMHLKRYLTCCCTNKFPCY